MKIPATKALAHLRQADPVMATVIERVGPCQARAHMDGTHFGAVLRSIVYQQLSGKAAATIHGRVLDLYGGDEPSPRALLRTDDAVLRAAGLSGQKTRYVKDLATHATSRRFPINRLHELEDDEVIATLTQVKGVGRWTAQIFLMFRLGRPDVLPELDLGIQKGIQRAYALRRLPKPEQVLKRGRPWAPYRTIASWYLWRLLDLPAD
ncbi:MAG: DNA-3-methyladenine glycosylase 2 family protein [Gemmatimonadetes bacterium]|nr:DNA-3-methyladenine glycosylase 2 family protein [Gemmatimonadota bacterium]